MELNELKLLNPVHLKMVSNGHGEFPDSYGLTQTGIKEIQTLIIQAQIRILEEHIEHLTKPGYRRLDIIDKINRLKKELLK